MAGNVSDEAFARAIQELGVLTPEQLQAARNFQTEQARQGIQTALADVLIHQGLITPLLKANIEKRLGPRVIGPYELMGKLGEGAMGTVYRAKVRKTGIEVALKILPKKFAADQNYISRFIREAKAGLELEHEHVVRTVDFGDHEGTYFIALELIEGGDLSKRLKRLKVIPEADALRVIHEVSQGLQHAHECGLVHRDIKPANIMFTKDGKAKLSDFGLVKYTDPEASHLTQTGMTVGTPHYLAPEQAKGEKDVDIRADIYALGATLYHLVTGRPPFEGSSVGEVIMKHLTAELQSPDEITPDLSEGCVALIEKMMAKERADRYLTPAELVADLERVRAGGMPIALLEAGRSSVAVIPIRNNEGKLVTLVDQAMADHLASTAPPPSQASFDDLMDKVDRLRVWDDGMASGKPLGKKVLLDLSDVSELKSFRELAPGRHSDCWPLHVLWFARL